MKKVAVFGNSGGGKSTLSKKLAMITNLPLHILDKIQFQTGGLEVEYEDYISAHEEILKSDEWIIDGFGCVESLWKRLDMADTLVYIDLPLYIHFALVTKRMVEGLFKNPDGWPEKSPIFKSSFNSYRVIMLCHRRMTPRYRDYVSKISDEKMVYHLKSFQEISEFVRKIETLQRSKK